MKIWANNCTDFVINWKFNNGSYKRQKVKFRVSWNCSVIFSNSVEPQYVTIWQTGNVIHLLYLKKMFNQNYKRKKSIEQF